MIVFKTTINENSFGLTDIIHQIYIGIPKKTSSKIPIVSMSIVEFFRVILIIEVG